MLSALFILFVFIAFILVMRLLGAWMLRINEMIQLLKTISDDLNEIRINMKNYINQENPKGE